MRVLLIVVAVLAVLILGKVLLANKTPAPTNSTPTTEATQPSTETKEEAETLAKADLIQVDSPQPGGLITNPVTITGKARGQWYFEASFPIKIFDEAGQVIGQGIAEAQGDWMTSEFVPFVAKVTFTKSPTKTGTILLEKDNPSGLPEHADSIRISIRFE